MRSGTNPSESLGARRSPAPAEINFEARAQRVLAEYLRQWGLREPTTIAVHCRRWVRQAVESVGAEAASRPSLVYRTAIERAISDIDKWLDHLAMLACDTPDEASRRRGLLALEMQALVDRYPHAILRYHALPVALIEHLRRVTRVPVPEQRPRRMRPQPLARSALGLVWRRWRRSLRHALGGTGWRRLAGR